jgi:putative ABC transport system permease protein
MSAAAASFFGGFALLLAVLGIYGVTSYGVSRRTSEIGVRMALGATRADVVRLITGGALATAAIGVVAGLSAAAAATRFISSLLYGVSTLDPLTLALVTLLLLLTTALAAVIPARRASRIDPWRSLRAE